MNFSLDLVNHGLPKIGFKSTTKAPVDNFLQTVLFGGAPIMGTEGVNGIAFDWRHYAPHIAEEALRNADPTRVNYGTSFNSQYVETAYFFPEDEVTLNHADARAFGEDITVNVDSKKRVIQAFADKRDAFHDSFTLAKEKLCADALISASVTVRNGGAQTYPMTASLLSLTGSTLYSDFLGTIGAAANAIRKKNKAFRANAIVLNPTYAGLLVQALKAAGLFDKEVMNLGVVRYEGIMGNGAEICGAVNAPGCPNLLIVAYYGVDASNDYYIPNQKAVLCNLDMGVGSMGYGRVQAYTPGVGKHFVVEQERYVADDKGVGDTRTRVLQGQTAPIPLITNIDGYGVLANIPSSLS